MRSSIITTALLLSDRRPLNRAAVRLPIGHHLLFKARQIGTVNFPHE
jgi:hypothetical protein